VYAIVVAHLIEWRQEEDRKTNPSRGASPKALVRRRPSPSQPALLMSAAVLLSTARTPDRSSTPTTLLPPTSGLLLTIRYRLDDLR
jgi:hypothetical protein